MELVEQGRRPFLFISLDETFDCLGQLYRVAARRLGVTLLVEGRTGGRTIAPPGSASLAALRQLPNASLLSPKDGIELGQMLTWCASQSDPAIVWLPDDIEPPVTWPRGTEVRFGRAERLGTGSDVAIIAWGPAAAAAAIAAESLAQSGVRAAVVNARFAHPLDETALVDAATHSAALVVIDDDQRGGFAGWVTEQLVEAGVGERTVRICRLPAAGPHSSATYSACADAIVEHCRWLSEPIARDPLDAPMMPEAARPSTAELESVARSWPEYLDRHAARTASDRAQVLARHLSADVRRWVRRYEEVGSRDLYLWKWCAHGVELTTLPCVLPELRAHVCDTKMLSIILCVLLDDVADEHGSGRLLDTLLDSFDGHQLPPELSAAEARHVDVTRALWSKYWQRVRTYPGYPEFEPVLCYDLLQFQNTMRYSHLVNERPYLLNLAEHDLYASHNMMMISFATLDLMCSPGFPREEVGLLRQAMWHAQCMGRTGNLLSTWRREVANRDFTSGVFARAIIQGDVTHEQLARGSAATLTNTICQRGHEDFFFRKWLEHRECCHACAGRIASIDLHKVLEGHDRFLAMHLGSEGLI